MTDPDQHPEAVELEERQPQPVLSIRATVPVIPASENRR